MAGKYNNAMIAVESNNFGHSTLNTLINTVNYPFLYYYERYSDGQRRKEPGFPTDAKTRPVLLSEFREAVENESMVVNDKELLAECNVFVTNPAGKPEARAGYHDDRIFAWGIAWQARKYYAPTIHIL